MNLLGVFYKMGLELDLGCGKNKHKGAIGLDMNRGLVGVVDVIHEVTSRTFLPFLDNSFSKVYMLDFIEHIPDIPHLLSEVHRVSKPHAEVIIRYPHYSDPNAKNDSTHIHQLGLRCFDHFDPTTAYGKKYAYYAQYDSQFPFRIIAVKPTFRSTEYFILKTSPIARGLYKRFGPDIYEAHFSSLLPIENVEVVMNVIKCGNSL